MNRIMIVLLTVPIITIYLSSCTVPNQSPSFQDQISMMASRKSVDRYKEVRAQFIAHAKARESRKLYGMMEAYQYDESEIVTFLKGSVFPFFSDSREVVEPEIFNIVNDEVGDPGYTMYGFILTVNGKRKP